MRVASLLTLFLTIPLPAGCQRSQDASGVDSAGSFDAPIRKEVVDLGPDPGAALSCFYFPDFLVKEYYLGGKGAERLSIVRNPGRLPECSGAQEPGERVIEYPEWQGYFKGVKDDLVFFNDSDTFNGGFPFAVFDSVSGNKVFEDSAAVETASSSNVRISSKEAGYMLEYRRVVRADCDLHAESSVCWDRIKAAFSLPGDEMPLCTGYDGAAVRAAVGQLMSVIAYPVEVTLSPDTIIRAVPGPVTCWPEI